MEEEKQNQDDELCEIDVTEVSLDEDEINELIEKLEELKENKGEVTFELDEDNEILIKYEESEEEDSPSEADLEEKDD